MTTAPYHFTRQGRSLSTICVIGGIWAALVLAWWVLEAAVWLIGLVFLATLPALRDVLRNPPSGLSLDDTALSWHSDRRHAEVMLEETDHMQLNTRLDFSVSASVVLRTGRKIKLPFEATPPHREFEAALEARGITVKRHHFQLMQ